MTFSEASERRIEIPPSPFHPDRPTRQSARVRISAEHGGRHYEATVEYSAGGALPMDLMIRQAIDTYFLAAESVTPGCFARMRIEDLHSSRGVIHRNCLSAEEAHRCMDYLRELLKLELT